jgi:hypothetical protein
VGAKENNQILSITESLLIGGTNGSRRQDPTTFSTCPSDCVLGS